ncbi:hypothetical protein Acr_00g0081240 [Actinidia rufa]|uniref:Uncharacterized protein n=1 Tax=Actinidia rufa TaxID=165716 RepID=A0A7J0DW33_9ERIC|nr:hypothetical protein Acr_00g0081240 [Actinidia rufa]
MAALQRSAVSFRRQGSSGVIWEDRFYSGDLNMMKRRQEQEANKEFGELRKCQSFGSTTARIEPSQLNEEQLNSLSCNGLPTGHPLSPRVSGCWFCFSFRKQAPNPHLKSGNKKC